MQTDLSKLLDGVVKTATVFLTFALVWFSLVYYPKVLNQFKNQSGERSLVGVVSAGSLGLPYDNGNFRIEYSAKQNIYLVAIRARTPEGYGQFVSESQITLKNILSLDNLCGLNVVYMSNLPFADPDKSTQGSC